MLASTSTHGLGLWLYFTPLPIKFASSCPMRSWSPQTGGSGPLIRSSAFLRAQELTQVGLDDGHQLLQIDHRKLTDHLAGAGELEQALDHGAHPAGGLDEIPQILLPVVFDPVSIVFHQEIRKGDQGAQGLLQIVRDDVDELVELAVLLRKLDVGFSEPLVLFLQLGFQQAVERDVLGNELGVGDRCPWSR